MFGGSDGNAIAYYKNGTKKWMHSLGLWVISNPAISPKDVVYFGSENAQMCVCQMLTLHNSSFALHPTAAPQVCFQ